MAAKKYRRSNIDWPALVSAACAVQENAWILGNTRVGAAVLSEKGRIYMGCNIEHKFRSHDIHAEVNAISSMIAGGDHIIRAILIVAKRKKFTPCGACLDWIFEFGGKSCLIGFIPNGKGKIKVYKSCELMPHYPV